MQIFHTFSFAIVGLLLTGLSWCFVGIVMSDASRRRCDVRLIMLISYLLTGIFSLFIFLRDGGFPEGATGKLIFFITLNDILVYVLNFGMQYTMSFAMQKGPNGLIWGIVQSATVFPFIMGMILGDVISIYKIGGVLLLLSSLVLFAISKDNSVNSDKGNAKVLGLSWLAWAFISYTFTAFEQAFSTLPSYFSSAVELIPVSYRLTVAGFVGAICGLAVLAFVPARPEDGTIKSNFCRPAFWALNFAMLVPSLLAGLYLMYPALNILAPLGMGGIGYPTMVGSCVVFFTIISWTYYHEKFSWRQLWAVIVCLIGLVCMCAQSL